MNQTTQNKQTTEKNIKDVFVLVDDIDLPLGKIRYRETGSGGTHNGNPGLRSKRSDDFTPDRCAYR